MKKFLITLISVILCAACAFGFTACGDDDTKNPDGSPKNMAETIIDFDAESTNVYCWSDYGNTASSSSWRHIAKDLLGDNMDYGNYGSFSFMWKKGCKYKITKLEFDITSVTASTITINCNFTEPTIGGGKGEYKHLSEMSIENGQTVHIVFDNLNCSYSKFAQSIKFKNNGETTDKSVLNWQIKISNLFITAEKV